MKRLLFVFTALTVAFSDVSASADGEKSYVGVKAGAYHPDTSGGITRKLDTGTIGEIAIGHSFTGNLAAEIGYLAYTAEKTLPAVDVSESTIHSMSAGAPFFTVRGLLPLADGRMELFAGGGLGAYRVKVNIKDPPPPPVERSEREKKTGYHVLGGIDYNASRRVALGLELKWFSVKTGDTKLGGRAVSLGLKYRL